MDTRQLINTLFTRLNDLGEKELVTTLQLASETGSTGTEARDTLSRALSEERAYLIKRYPELEVVIARLLTELQS